MSEVLSIYTPSNLKPETLEEIFVQRHKLLKKSVQWVEESILTKKKNHLLFVGSRGSGKTHLISMIVNRLKTNDELNNKMVLVWLGEDDVITNFLDFVLSMLRAMAEDSEFNLDCLEVAKGKGHNEAVDIILGSIMEQLGNRTLLVVKENMSDVFAGLKDDGQKKLRAFLQEKKNMVLLTSSQQLFEGVSSRDAAFFGFFDIHHLEPLSVDDAMELIAKVSKLKGDQALYDFVHTSQGRYRVRALHHLAGGNQRLYMNLLEFLTVESLDKLVPALNKLADDLTPYFQERIKSLPPQQGKIVQKLCDIEGALPVKSIAEELFIGERSVAKQLGELLKKNYVLAHKRGKQTYYEIAEPLMRLSLEVKHNHGKPLKMLVLLLRAWFSDNDLEKQLEDKINTQILDYLKTALKSDKNIVESLHNDILDNLNKSLQEDEFERTIELSMEMIESPHSSFFKIVAMSTLCTAYMETNKMNLAIKYSSMLIDNLDSTIDDEIIERLLKIALDNRAACYYEQKEYSLSRKDFRELLNNTYTSKDQRDYIENVLLKISYQLKDYKESHKIFENILKSKQVSEESMIDLSRHILEILVNKGHTFWEEEIRYLVSIFKKYNMMVSLGGGLLFSIKTFSSNKNIVALFSQWQAIWEEVAEDEMYIEIPLQALKASKEALEAKSDKPLFELPKEVRDLVLPLIKDAIE